MDAPGAAPDAARSGAAIHQAVFDHASDGLFVADSDGRYLDVNLRGCEIVGYSRDELLRLRLHDLLLPEDLAHDPPQIEDLRAGRMVVRERRLRRKDGSVARIEISARMFPDGRLLGIVRDIEERTRLADRLARSEARYRLLFTSNPEPMWVYDLETLAFLAVNDAAVARYGYSREEFLGMTIADIRPAEDVPRLREAVEAVTEGYSEAGVWRHRRRDGSILEVEIASHVLEFEGRRAELVHAHDMTGRRRAEERVRFVSRLYALLSQVNQVIVRTADLPTLFAETCRVAVEHGGFRMAWIGVLDQASGRVRPVAHAGHEAGYLERIVVTAAEDETGRGPTGVAARQGALVVCEDIATDPRMGPWREEALRRGYRSSAAVPFRGTGLGTGLLNLYARTPSPFAAEERELLAKIGEDLSFAVESLEADRRRREAEAALRESEARLEKVLTVSPVTVYTLGVSDGRLAPTWVSDNIRHVLGYPPEEVRGEAWWAERVHPEDRERVLAGVPRLFTDGRLVHEYRFRARDGGYRWILDELVLLREGAGEPREVIGAWTDVTWRRAMEEERLELQRQFLHAQKLESLGVLAGGVAHDFNNLLLAVSGYLELALEGATPPQREHLEQAARAAQRAADLTRQILAYSGRGRFVIGPLDLNALVRENVDLLRASIPKSVQLATRLDATLPGFEADAGQIQQVVMNLVANAADATLAGGGCILVATGTGTFDADALRMSRVVPTPAPGRFVVLDVEDDGCGMDEATRDRLFDPFFTTKPDGRGLGMAAILGIVQAHRGAIFVDSAPGRGSHFRVLFPVGDAPGPTGPRPRSVAARDAAVGPTAALPGRVLLADDEPIIRDLAGRMLRHLGLDPVVVADGLQAVAAFRGDPRGFDCVLLDLSMPGMNGRQCMSAIREIRPGTPVILSSGYDETESVRSLPADDAVVFMQKPYTLEQLRRAIREATAPRTA